MSEPLVSVICLCYNQAEYVIESIQSILDQTYQNIEIIVVDDGSNDDSVERIVSFINECPKQIMFIPLSQNIGNCKAFNKAFAGVQGKYIIDLAADDILLSDRVEQGVSMLEVKGEEYGVHFSNAEYMDEKSHPLKPHYLEGESVPEGDIYMQLLNRYFICTPTMMMRKSLLSELGGYDGNLAYEDFDFWVRSSRSSKYCYSDVILVRKRITSGSLSSKQYGHSSNFLESTYEVCLKAQALNRTDTENKALLNRVKYEMRQSIFARHFSVAGDFLNLYKQLGGGLSIFYSIFIKTKLAIPFIKP